MLVAFLMVPHDVWAFTFWLSCASIVNLFRGFVGCVDSYADKPALAHPVAPSQPVPVGCEMTGTTCTPANQAHELIPNGNTSVSSMTTSRIISQSRFVDQHVTMSLRLRLFHQLDAACGVRP